MSNDNNTTTPVASASFASETNDRLAMLEAQAAAAATGQGGGSQSNTQYCTVTAVRSGKSEDRTMEVAVGTTLDSLMAGFGWSTDGCTFKKKTDGGPLVECTGNTVLGEGTHFVVCSPKVVGGLNLA